MKIQNLCQQVLMQFQNFFLIGLQLIIGMPIKSLLVMEFCLIMNQRKEEKHLLQEKLLEVLLKLF